MDAERVEVLLNILDVTRQTPDLKPIFDEAYKELTSIARELLEAKAKEEESEDA